MVSDPYWQLAHHYDDIIWRTYGKRLIAYFDRFVGAAAGARRHLDVGCGTGGLLQHSAARGFEVAGVDISPSMLDEAARKVPSAQLRCMDAMDLRGGSWQLITANNDVLNHLADRHDLQEVLEHWAGMLHPEGVVLTDVVSASDVRHNWDGVEQVYSDGVSFRCEVSHELVDRVGAVGRMVRRWWRCVDGAWLRAGLEEEVVRGVEREDIEAAAGAAGLHAELWDWDGGGVYEERTVRIGIVLRALNSGS